ncbi:MAG: hypothetical protein ACOVQX_01080 [Legionella sp.]
MKPFTNTRGAVLLTTIVMVSSLALLLLSLLQSVWLYHKAIIRMLDNHRLSYQLELAAHHLILHKDQLLPCQISKQTPNQIVQSLLSGQGCRYQFDNQHYRYLVVDMPIKVCYWLLLDRKLVSVSHKLMTVIDSRHHLLQLRWVSPANSELCKKPIRVLDNMIVSWRYLSYPSLIRGGIDS